jgi:hypothetical protein
VVLPNDAAFEERRVTIIRALNRAAAFDKGRDATLRDLQKDEDCAATAML